MNVNVVPFEPRFALAFKELNTAWLEAYFYVEVKDVLLLENCKENIIDKGGHIFIATINNNAVGCFSFIKITDTIYELGKMAVESNYKGHKIGQQMLTFSIDFAKQNGWEKIILYSSTKLPTALYIYKKHGFKEVELEKNLPYERSDIKMELILKY